MRRPLHRASRAFLATLAITSSLLLPATSGYGQNLLRPADKTAAGKASPGAEVALPTTEEGIDRKIGQIQARLGELRVQKATKQDNVAGSGMTPDESAEWRRLDLQRIYLLELREQALKDLHTATNRALGVQ